MSKFYSESGLNTKPRESDAKWNKFKVFYTNGTFTVPENVEQVYVSICGGGGGATSDFYYGGCGAGAVVDAPISVVPNSVHNVIIGAAGAALPYASGYGEGGASSFGTIITCSGGNKGGVRGAVGTVDVIPPDVSEFGFSGTKYSVVGGTTKANIKGVTGLGELFNIEAIYPIQDGVYASSITTGENGGSSALGKGATGGGSTGGVPLAGIDNAGFGGGGASGAKFNNTQTSASPAGNGICIVRWKESL